MKERHLITVRRLVEVVLRAGDLDLRFAGPSRSVEGIRIHQQIQAQRPDAYQPEVPVAIEVETPSLVLVVRGRIDGVQADGDTTLVEEIKSTNRELALVKKNRNACHWGQAKVYAYLLAAEQELEQVTVRLTYCHVDSKETVEHQKVFATDDLKAFFHALIERYQNWATRLARWRGLRDASIEALDFPFATYRSGQRTMAVCVYRAIRDGTQALIQAATGIGKTMAALFPAVKSLGEGRCERIFFLTARNTGKAAASRALEILQEKGLRIRRVSLTAKDQICFCPEATCNPDQCEYARGHFDRLPAALDQAFDSDDLDRSTIEAVARQHRVCPFELSLELTLWADCILCDYNYAFDPRVYLRRFFDEESGNYLFLVDEAHNLVDRSREMFSARLAKQDFLELRRAVKDHLPGVYRAAGKINTWMLAARNQTESAGGFEAASPLPEGLDPLLRHFLRSAERWLSKNQPAPYREMLLERYFQVNAFVRAAERYDDSYVTCYRAGGKNLVLTLFCLDPSTSLRAALQRARAAIFFSATLTPADYFQQILGCGAEATRLALGSPFPRERLCILLADHISTYYDQRARSAAAIADLIRCFVGRKRGNYLCFFPSYAYLEMVAEPLIADPTCEVIVQEKEMDEHQRAGFLGRFRVDNDHSLVGLAVMGGIFAEGVDLVGDRLSGAVIVGVGLPAIGAERDLIRDYFDRQGQGFDFAYRFPGINRVLQAAGRVIRSEEDKGAVLLVDQRFGRPAYRQLLPGHWTPGAVRSLPRLEQRLRFFWEETG